MTENESIQPKQTFLARAKSSLRGAFVSLLNQRVIFVLSVLLCVAMCLEIYDVTRVFKLHWNFFNNICRSLIMAILFTLPAALLSQKLSALKKYALQIGVAAVGGVLGYFSQKGFGNSVYNELYFYGIGFAVVALIIFVFIPKENARTYFAGLFKHFLFCSLMSLVLCGGLCLLIYAVQNLILGTNAYEPYSCAAAFSFLVFAVNSFVYYLFYRREEESSGKAFKVIVLYIMLPIFAVLLVVLYAYLLKAAVLRRLPNGQINWFVSFASCIYIVFYFILREYDDLPAVRVFYRFGAFAFIPLVCVQIPAYCIRVNAYGFTGARVSSLLFIIFSIVTIALTFVKKGRFCKYALLFLSAEILLGSVSPFNLIQSAYKNQLGRMKKVMQKYELYDEATDSLTNYDRTALEQAISDEDREILYSSYRYVVYKSDLPNPKWAEKEYEQTVGNKTETKVETLNFMEAFGIKDTRDEYEMQEFNFSVNDKILNIVPFARMESFDEYEYVNRKWDDEKKVFHYEDGSHTPTLKATLADGSEKSYDLTDFLLARTERTNSEPIWYSPDESVSFCFTYINFEYNKDLRLFRQYSMRGYVFYVE